MITTSERLDDLIRELRKRGDLQDLDIEAIELAVCEMGLLSNVLDTISRNEDSDPLIDRSLAKKALEARKIWWPEKPVKKGRKYPSPYSFINSSETDVVEWKKRNPAG